MKNTIELIKNYKPYNEQEIADKEYFLDCQKLGDLLSRETKQAHFTSSAFIVNKERTKVLCIYHNIYNSWSWVGGHADNDDDMLYVAKKETKEETSLSDFKEVKKEPIAIDALCVHSHYKNGKYVPSHIHLNITFLIEASEENFIHIQEEENSDIGWLTFEELLTKSTEKHMIKVYEKIINRIRQEKI